MKRVIVGLSGGVDSSVAALLLKQQGYDVLAVFMQNWESDNENPECSLAQDFLDAKSAAHHIGIPLETVDFSHEYWHHVFQSCLNEFSSGRTPNPDVLCNREIKFKALLNYAIKQGADYLATGHYAQIQRLHDEYQLLRGKDPIKDQSYFLYMLDPLILSRILFPLGQLKKTQVRQIAEHNSLPNAKKKDSTGICFIGERKFSVFLNEFLLSKPGDIKTLAGKTVGEHNGLMFYTLGQRKGLNIGGLKEGDSKAWYVIDKDIDNNILYIGQGSEHPHLFSHFLSGTHWHWHNKKPSVLPFYCQARTRYHQSDYACKITRLEKDNFSVKFDQALRAITPGQSIVFYQKEACLGGGIIAQNR